MESPYRPVERRILTVSEFSRLIKSRIEDAFPFVWISGEISNFSAPSSGHFYFTLKDAGAQIRAVMFKGINRHLKFTPKDGMAAIALGRVSVYEPQGTYQLIVEHLEPAGLGALAAAFWQLKERLAAEGLFDEKFKKPLPFLPRLVSVVTSPTGAVIHDILRIARRRFENARIQVAPVKVQGESAAAEIAAALSLLNARAESDVIILARGGGSLEDLAPFNSETVARAIFASQIPVVSAVGHETDTTISDFVADLRAPTPTAAAGLVWPDKNTLIQRLDELAGRNLDAARRRIEGCGRLLSETARRLFSPRQQVERHLARLENLLFRLETAATRLVESRERALDSLDGRLEATGPAAHAQKVKALLELFELRLRHAARETIAEKTSALSTAGARLSALSPDAVLARGYSITRSLPTGSLIRRADQTRAGRELSVTLSSGSLVCRVEKVNIAARNEDEETRSA